MPNLLEIYVVLDEESDVRLPKKPKKNYDISHKCKETWLSYSIPLSRNVKKCYGKVNKVKCTVYSFVKGKDVFLGPNSDTFEKHVRKTKVIWDMCHLGKKKGKWYYNKKCNHAKT